MGRPTLFSDMPGSTDPFDQAYGPENANPISPFDLATSDSTAFGYALEGALDLNPFPMAVRQLRVLKEDMFGGTERVSAEDARKENAERGFDLTVPDGGISRYELDMLQYFKQREVRRNRILMGSTGLTGMAAQFAGGLTGTLADPINIASMFIPIVPEARVAAMLARQSASMVGRAGVRAGVGAVEGAVGAALIEPITYTGAQLQQAEYSVADSFVNVMFGGVAGGGLHMLGGGVYDYRGAKAAKGIDALMLRMRREGMARAPDEVHLEALRRSVDAAENDMPPRAKDVYDTYEAQRRADGYNADGTKKLFYIDEPPRNDRLSLRDLGAMTARADTPVDAEEGYVYHATNVERAQEIADTGNLNPHDPGAYTDQDAWPDGATQPRIYFSGDPKVVGAFAPEDGESVIIRTVKPDDAKKESGTGDIVAEKPVPSDKLEILGADGKWHPINDVFKAADQYDREATATAGGDVPRSAADDPRNVAAEMEKTDSWAQEAKRDGAAFDPKEAAKDFPDEETYAAQLDALKAHIQSLKNRELLTPELEAMIKEGDEAAKKMEQEAEAYEAAVICEAEL